ncbi:two-component system, chemotaxis family, response regulator CheY [Reichenbachiella agariperforans]|uniref:Two-component system, chemotaxis family, response regulator CheY n=1 Tax=Reichenbachiella agariperforans TaxID=156994 RepID=A0A1M6T0X1_REIAG|nr:response regulator [Reichenbachiella agariperforans]SHK50576.1 two-component system, chemotaxis family, response regulator CheY [Reichenbachiella agariperforans]
MKTVLVVDDSAYMRALIKIALNDAGYNVVGEAEDGAKALELARSLQPDLITLDNILPDMFGIEILQQLTNEGNAARIIMISAVGQDRIINKVKKMGAYGYIVKPFEPELLLSVVDEVCKSTAIA